MDRISRLSCYSSADQLRKSSVWNADLETSRYDGSKAALLWLFCQPAAAGGRRGRAKGLICCVFS